MKLCNFIGHNLEEIRRVSGISNTTNRLTGVSMGTVNVLYILMRCKRCGELRVRVISSICEDDFTTIELWKSNLYSPTVAKYFPEVANQLNKELGLNLAGGLYA